MTSTARLDESQRLDALEQYEVLDGPYDSALDDITRLASHICNAPVAAVTIVGADRIYLRSRLGIDARETPRGVTAFEATLLRDGVYEIPDARVHPDFGPHGIAFGGRTLRFYAGAPLVSPSGVAIGTLSVLDVSPRRLTPAQLNALKILGQQVITRLELSSRMRQMDRAARARQRVESALIVERNFVSAVLDTVGALVAVFDTAGRIVRFNRACEIASGYDFHDLVGRYVWEKLIPEDDVSEAIENFERIRAGGFPAAFENHWLARDGRLRRIAWSATALTDSQTQVAFIIATGIDVTVQRAAEDTLRESEGRYRELVEGSLGLVCTHDLDGVLLSMNTYGAKSLGRTIEEMTGQSLAEYLPPDRKDFLQPYLAEVITSGEAQGLVYLTHSGGDVRVNAYRNRLIRTPGNEPYILGFGIDITDQVRAEEQLRTLIRQSNSILESVGDGIFGIDLEGRVTFINPAAAQMLGWKAHEVLGRDMHALTQHTRADGSPYAAVDSPIRNTLASLGTVRVANEVFFRKDGSSFPVEYVARPQIDTPDDTPDEISSDPGSIDSAITDLVPRQESGKAVGVVVAFADTTERRALDRMKDEFISTVSHELRTPLTSLAAALGLVSGGALAGRPEKMQQMLDIAIGNTGRLVRLVNDILDLERISSGKAELHYTMCSVDDLLRRAAGLQQTGAAKANIHFTFDATSVNVWADPDRILQTVTNLISNAIKFSPGLPTKMNEIRLSAHYLPDDEALIEVADQGRGIPQDKLEQIFERFQQVDASDSRAMGGTGLGLAICRSIVAQHSGRIWATNNAAAGSTFHFTLPTKPSQNLR